MPSILSGCLILLKIAMAVNDGLHSMLSSIYSIIENVLSSDHGMEPVQETDSASVVVCSKSRILEAFNKRRANLPIFEQTEVYVSNVNPYQEITITKKDYDRKRKRSSSLAKKSQSKGVENPLNPHYVQGNEEICSSYPENSQSSTTSLVSSDTGNESEYQSCKTLNGSVELGGNIVDICEEPGDKNNMLENSTDEKTSIEADHSPDSSFLKVLESQIKTTKQTLQRALSNNKNPSTKNVYGLTDSESTDSKERASTEVSTSSSPEVSACRKQFLEETAIMYENFLPNFYYQNKDTNSRAASNKRDLKTESCISNRNEITSENGSFARRNSFPTCHPATSPWQVNESHEYQQKQNPLPRITLSDYSSGQTDSDCLGFGYLSDSKQVSKTPATKRINTHQLPLSLQKDKWVEMEDFMQSRIEESKKLYQNANLLKSDTLIQTEQTDVNQSLVDDESREEISSSEDGDSISVDVPEECQSPIKRNLNRRPFNLKGSNYSDELDNVSLEEVDLLKKVQDVGATEALDDSHVREHYPQKCMLNFVSKVESSYPEKCTVEDSMIISPPMTMLTDLLDVDHIPLKELDTEEKQITYLNNLTENYMKRMKTMVSEPNNIQEIENELLDNFEERHKIMLDKITTGYNNRLDSITRNAGMCLNELCSIDTDLKTKFGFFNFEQEARSTENCLRKCVSLQTLTSVGEIHASGLSFSMPNKFINESLKVVENKQMSDTFFKNKVNGLLETKNNSGTIFTLDSERNETSTPIKCEKIEDHIWVSINLSSGSQNEHSVNEGKDLVSSLFDSKLRANILGTDQNLALLDSRQELIFSENVKEDISLEEEDWRNLAEQMSKNYENVVSLLNSIDDDENFSLTNESVSNLSENESSNVKTDIIDYEKALSYDCAPEAHTEPRKTSTEDNNLTVESNSDIVNTSNEILISNLGKSLSDANATVAQGELEMKE